MTAMLACLILFCCVVGCAGLFTIVFATHISRYVVTRFPASTTSGSVKPSAMVFRVLGVIWLLVGAIGVASQLLST